MPAGGIGDAMVAATMRAAVYEGPGELTIRELPVPEPGPGDALVEVSHCGICGTDLHLVLEGMGAPNQTPGHEWSGRVVAVGEGVTGLAPGDGVVGGPRPSCGACEYCVQGRTSLCVERPGFGGGDTRYQGAFAQYVLAPATHLLRIPRGLGPREAALAEPLAVALHALTLGRVAPDSGDAFDKRCSALVTGAGPLGLLLVAALRARGVGDVRVSEPSALRRECAARAGASRTCHPDALEIPVMPFDLVRDPVDLVFDCSGNPRAMEAGLAQLKRAGALVIVGTGMKRPRFDHNRILLNELLVTGAYTYDDGGMSDALELLASRALATDALIEPDDVPLRELLPTLHGLAAGEIGAKVMIVPDGKEVAR
jgi:2-desacetyl-2-hydroxyethyl bacteriochlorophyllide A dehydrogenase